MKKYINMNKLTNQVKAARGMKKVTLIEELHRQRLGCINNELEKTYFKIEQLKVKTHNLLDKKYEIFQEYLKDKEEALKSLKVKRKSADSITV
jgi:hypothetical protein